MSKGANPDHPADERGFEAAYAGDEDAGAATTAPPQEKAKAKDAGLDVTDSAEAGDDILAAPEDSEALLSIFEDTDDAIGTVAETWPEAPDDPVPGHQRTDLGNDARMAEADVAVPTILNPTQRDTVPARADIDRAAAATTAQSPQAPGMLPSVAEVRATPVIAAGEADAAQKTVYPAAPVAHAAVRPIAIPNQVSERVAPTSVPSAAIRHPDGGLPTLDAKRPTHRPATPVLSATTRAQVQTRAVPQPSVSGPAYPLDLALSGSGETAGETTMSRSLNLEAVAAWETRAAAPAATSATSPRPELPAQVGRQMAEALQNRPDRPVELSLNPEELGRVRLSISTAEGAITVNVLAERPETLDLMRRHIDALAREFAAIGYGDIAFGFAQGEAGAEASADDGHDTSAAERAEPGRVRGRESVDAPVTLLLGKTSGLDIRL
ncbi:flagellar hook-length control protein FliK [Sulfitobacter sp. D35]|uniref:flagellar hook-length control protein FliK n=1 Tax=Sulfitobacter sp. D35 TaxID=3083252 RepID=UPI00296F6D7A|nr:flagellar hook-length control protein FliK [Sulfitobacter sp. D35]MDW4498256.1 flagellar hook-length control protein FliK [Sulfitobacter sp. D35]